MKRFQIVRLNSYINSRQVITKKVSIPLDKLTFLQQVWSISGEIRASTRKPHWLLGKSVRRRHLHCSSWNTLDNCPIKIPSLEGIIYLFHIPRPASHVESLADDTWNQLLSGTYNLWMILLCPDLVTPQVPGEKERESGQFYEVFPVFELILYLQGRHEYSSKHSKSLFCKRYLCQHTRHSCFNCSIRVEMNRQQLLGVAREVQSFSSPSLNNR